MEVPDYDYLRRLLKEVIAEENSSVDFFYDWCKTKPNINANDPIFTNDYNIQYDGDLEWLNRKYCLEEMKRYGLINDDMDNNNNIKNSNVYINKNNLVPDYAKPKIKKDVNNIDDEEKNNDLFNQKNKMEED